MNSTINLISYSYFQSQNLSFLWRSDRLVTEKEEEEEREELEEGEEEEEEGEEEEE